MTSCVIDTSDTFTFSTKRETLPHALQETLVLADVAVLSEVAGGYPP